MNTQNSNDINQVGHLDTFAKVRSRNPHTNIWFNHSPKNDRLQAITGDLPFYLTVLLEGDQEVESYVPSEFDHQHSTESIRVAYRCGRTEVWSVRRKGSKGAAEVARALSVGEMDARTVKLKTDDDIRGREIAIDNWLLLCSAITRARLVEKSLEIAALRDRITQCRSASLEELLSLGKCRAAMHAVIAASLQRGLLHTNLETFLFGGSSILSWGPTQ